jgi:hypothetical protein
MLTEYKALRKQYLGAVTRYCVDAAGVLYRNGIDVINPEGCAAQGQPVTPARNLVYSTG